MKTKIGPSFAVKQLDGEPGTFEAIVAVFGNIDRAGDRIIKGAFADSLKAWGERGRPIPVIFSHQWNDLDAFIGRVVEAKEVDEGLYVKAQLDMESQKGQDAWRHMMAGTLAEFSFAYDVIQEKRQNGANELLKLDLLEVGPTLVGMNPATRLLAVKSDEYDPGRKTLVLGSHEETASQIADAVRDRYETADAWAYVYATFDDRAIVLVSDADGERYIEVQYTKDDDGSIQLGSERAVDLRLDVIGKSAATVTPKEPTEATGKERAAATLARRVALQLLELDVA